MRLQRVVRLGMVLGVIGGALGGPLGGGSQALASGESAKLRLLDNFAFLDKRTVKSAAAEVRIEHSREAEHTSTLRVEGNGTGSVMKTVVPGSLSGARYTGVQFSAKSAVNNVVEVVLSGKRDGGGTFKYAQAAELSEGWKDIFLSFEGFKLGEKAISEGELRDVTSITLIFRKGGESTVAQLDASIDSLGLMGR
jgi:hypothetical protein